MNLPRPGTTERVQAGSRPAIVLHSDDSLNQVSVVVLIPGTKQLAALRFKYTVALEPSPANGLILKTVFLGFQVQSVDRSWVVDPRIGRLSEDELWLIEDAVLGALGFDLPPEAPDSPSPPQP